MQFVIIEMGLDYTKRGNKPLRPWSISLQQTTVQGVTTLQSEGDSIGNVPPLFQLKQPNLQAYSETDHSSVLTNILHRSSREINIPVQIQTSDYQLSGKSLHKLLGWPQRAT